MTRLYRFLLKGALLAIIGMFAVKMTTGPRNVGGWLDARAERARLESQLQSVQAQKQIAAAELDAFRRDPRFIEEQIKIVLKKGKPGEVYYHFDDKPADGVHDVRRPK